MKKNNLNSAEYGYKDNKLAMPLSPHVTSATVVNAFNKSLKSDAELVDIAFGIAETNMDYWDGEHRHCEAMLLSQACALEGMFTSLALMAERRIDKNIESAEKLMKMALKAQSQCRSTLETLFALKNPPVVFANQANITSGPQQVNNGGAYDGGATDETNVPPSRKRERAREIKLEKNELLEADNGKRMESGAKRKAVSADQNVEAVGKSNRS